MPVFAQIYLPREPSTLLSTPVPKSRWQETMVEGQWISVLIFDARSCQQGGLYTLPITISHHTRSWESVYRTSQGQPSLWITNTTIRLGTLSIRRPQRLETLDWQITPNAAGLLNHAACFLSCSCMRRSPCFHRITSETYPYPHTSTTKSPHAMPLFPATHSGRIHQMNSNILHAFHRQTR